jgi:hypothetical protein
MSVNFIYEINYISYNTLKNSEHGDVDRDMMETKGCVQPLTTGSVLKIRVFFHFELGGHLGWKSGSTDTI